jgi:hypothetical protein
MTFIRVGAAALAALLIPLAATAPSAAAAARSQVSDSFESGTLAGLPVHHHAWASRAAADHGHFGLRIKANRDVAGAAWNSTRLRQGQHYWSLRAYLRIDKETPHQAVDLLAVLQSAKVHNFNLFLAANQRFLHWDLANTDFASSKHEIKLHTWYLIEADGHFGAGRYSANVRIDGVPQGSISSSHQPNATVRQLVMGTLGTVQTSTKDFDDVKLKLSQHPLGFLGPASS